jgi:hypothetical protein
VGAVVKRLLYAGVFALLGWATARWREELEFERWKEIK